MPRCTSIASHTKSSCSIGQSRGKQNAREHITVRSEMKRVPSMTLAVSSSLGILGRRCPIDAWGHRSCDKLRWAATLNQNTSRFANPPENRSMETSSSVLKALSNAVSGNDRNNASCQLRAVAGDWMNKVQVGIRVLDVKCAVLTGIQVFWNPWKSRQLGVNYSKK